MDTILLVLHDILMFKTFFADFFICFLSVWVLTQSRSGWGFRGDKMRREAADRCVLRVCRLHVLFAIPLGTQTAG